MKLAPKSRTREQEGSAGFFRDLHTGVKVGVTLVYIVTIVSFDRHTVGRLTPFLAYPVLVDSWVGLSLKANLRRLLPALPFCVFAGLSNLLFEQEPAFTLAGITMSRGVVSCCSLIFRAILCTEALILLTESTPVHTLVLQMRAFGAPGILVMLFEMTHRYIGVISAEARSLHTAYTLRSGGIRGVDIHHAGSFIGSLFLRCTTRAERIGVALKLRGYSEAGHPLTKNPVPLTHGAFLALVCFFCVLFRFIDMPLLLGNLWFSLFT
ncbi:MAG: energy-coupling factor transporter transmembrane protein EcfT [Treponema sp.]|jgi:cobalt/nickel transport system permease protein|nr:energy-coupling factor transporter transmembrane protein EcfT [Treponema sp.]